VQFLSLDDRFCALRSDAFSTSLHCRGLSGSEFAGLFSSGSRRPDWHRLAEGLPLQIGLAGELPLEASQPSPGPWLVMDQGEVALTSDQPGQARIDPGADLDERLLPQPLHLLLAQQWARLGLFPLHAAAIEWQDRGVLLLGQRAAGKSSLVLAALAHGARIVSDDWLLVGRDAAGQWRAERLRQFLMLRPGRILDTFSQPLPPDLIATRDGRRVWPIGPGQAQFPAELKLDRCLWLDTPVDARPARSVIGRIDQAKLLARLIESAMPILLTRNYPVETAALMDAFRALSTGLLVHTAVSGQDLLDKPAQVLERLLLADQA